MIPTDHSLVQLRFTLAAACLLLLILAPGRASDPWQGPYATGTSLWHLDEVTGGATPSGLPGGGSGTLAGAVSLDTTQKFYGFGSLHFTGGSLSISNFDWSGGDRSLEAFVRVAQYPAAGQAACLFALVDAQGKTIHAVTLTPDGRLRLSYVYNDYLQERSGQQGSVSTPAGSIPPGKWTHISIHALQYYQMVRLTVDGKILAEEHGEMLKGIYKLLVGNNPGGNAPFIGWMDELREAGETNVTPRPAPQDWLDPTRPAPAMDDPRFFPHRRDLLFYAPLDGDLTPAVAAGEKTLTWRKTATPPRFAPGLHGKALALGSPLDYPAKGNLRPEAGTVSCWVKVTGSPNEMGRIFKLGDSWDFMLSGSHGFYAASRTGRGVVANDMWGALRNISPGQWHQVALTWQGEWCTNYVDGQKAGDFLIPGGLKPYLDDRTTLSIGDGWMTYGKEDRAFLDEYRIYGEPLSPEEILNVYRAETGEKLTPVTSRSTRFTVYPGLRTVTALIRQDMSGITPGKGLLMTLLDSRGKTLARTIASEMVMTDARMSLSIPPLSAGDYVVKVTQAPGTATGSGLNDELVYHEAAYGWSSTMAGATRPAVAALENNILPPWTPIRYTADGFSLGDRTIRLNGSALPQSIEVAGAPLLAGPAYFEIDGSEHQIRQVTGSALKRVNQGPTSVLYTAMVPAGAFNISVNNETGYDGVSRITLQLLPSQHPIVINRLTLVIPLSTEEARYINAKGRNIRENYLIGALPAAEGRVFASTILPACTVKSDPLKLLADSDRYAQLKLQGKEIPKDLERLTPHGPEVTSGSFMPYLWVGSPERGFCWFADNDQGWVRGGMDVPAVEVRRAGDRTELRINLIGSPTTIREPRTIVFGLQPTPVRPLPPDWRKDYWYRDFRILGFGYEFQSGRYYLGQGTPGAYGGEPYPWNLKRAKWFSAIAKKKGWLQVPYFEFTNNYDPITGPMDAEWRVQPAAWRMQGGIMPVQSYADWFCASIDRYIKDVGIDGLYLDNVCPMPSLDDIAHNAWRDSDGQLQGSYNLWDLRTMLQRIRGLFLKDGVADPWLELHMTHSNLIPAMAYANVLLDGEDFYLAPEDAEDFMDRWPLDMLTAIDSPHTWGVPTLFLNHLKGGDWSKHPGGIVSALRTGIGEQLLVDLKGGSWEVGGVFRSMKEWGVDRADCQFTGHWQNRFHSADPDIKVAAYSRPGTMLLVITNFSHTAKTAHINFVPGTALPYPASAAQASDGETEHTKNGGTDTISPAHKDLDCKLSSDAAGWTVDAGPIPGRDFRLISIHQQAPR